MSLVVPRRNKLWENENFSVNVPWEYVGYVQTMPDDMCECFKCGLTERFGQPRPPWSGNQTIARSGKKIFFSVVDPWVDVGYVQTMPDDGCACIRPGLSEKSGRPCPPWSRTGQFVGKAKISRLMTHGTCWIVQTMPDDGCECVRSGLSASSGRPCPPWSWSRRCI